MKSIEEIRQELSSKWASESIRELHAPVGSDANPPPAVAVPGALPEDAVEWRIKNDPNPFQVLAIRKQSVGDLAWHIENDSDPFQAIALSEEVMIFEYGPFEERNGRRMGRRMSQYHLVELAHLIAKHLDHKDYSVRWMAVRCLVERFKLVDYAEKALEMAIYDPEKETRLVARATLGSVIGKVGPDLRKRIATYLYDVVSNSRYGKKEKTCAFEAITRAVKAPLQDAFKAPHG